MQAAADDNGALVFFGLYEECRDAVADGDDAGGERLQRIDERHVWPTGTDTTSYIYMLLLCFSYVRLPDRIA
jgi:hypothetical protein